MKAEEFTFKEDQKFKVINRADLRDELILLLQQAIEDPFNVSPEIKARIEELRKKLGMETEQEKNESVEESELNEEDDDFDEFYTMVKGLVEGGHHPFDAAQSVGEAMGLDRREIREYVKRYMDSFDK